MISFLVAFRDVDGTRTRLWEFIRARTQREFPEDEIVEASDDGRDPFWKTAALNDAARRAVGDVFVVWDADTWIQPDRIRSAAVVAEDPACWQKPYAAKVKLSAAATDKVLALGDGWDGTIHKDFGRPEHTTTFHGAPPFVLHRDAWDAVGGFDERFRGWGSEDVSFWHSLTVIVGKQVVGHRGIAVHLHHSRIGKTGNDYWQGQDEAGRAENKALGDRYKRARTPAQMRALIEERESAAVHLVG